MLDQRLDVDILELFHATAPSFVIVQPGHELIIKLVQQLRGFSVDNIKIADFEELVVDAGVEKAYDRLEKGKFILGGKSDCAATV